MDDLLPITVDDMIAEIERELKQRSRVYPRLVSSGKLAKDRADRQVKVMRAVRAHLIAEKRKATT